MYYVLTHFKHTHIHNGHTHEVRNKTIKRNEKLKSEEFLLGKEKWSRVRGTELSANVSITLNFDL